jgi:FemAB family protein
MINEILISELSSVGIRSDFRQTFSVIWDEILAKLDLIPVAYSQSEIDFQLAYLRGNGLCCQDISLILYHDNRPCGVWPLCYVTDEGRSMLNSYFEYGQYILPPLFVVSLADKTKKAMTKKCLNLVDKLCKSLHIKSWKSAESFIGEQSLSDWYEQSLRKNVTASLKYEVFVDLSLDMVKIKAKFRKSYKSLITKGMRIWKLGVMSEANPDLWESFRMLHLSTAGKVTRSIETWNLQYQAIVDGHAFLVYLHNDEEELVGGGYFAVTRDQGVYNVGVFKRALFDQPLGHVIQYRAIEEMKARGLHWYKIGLHRVSSQENETKKQLAISEFIQGFATHLFPQYNLEHNIETSS